MSRTAGFVQVQPDSTGKEVDTSVVTDGGQTTHRQVINIGDSQTAANIANVTAAGALQVDNSAVTQPTNAQPQAASLTNAAISTTTSGNQTIVAGVSAKTVKVYRLWFTVSAATTISFKDGTGTTLATLDLKAYGSVMMDFNCEPWFTTSANNGFVLNSSNTANIKGGIGYIQS